MPFKIGFLILLAMTPFILKAEPSGRTPNIGPKSTQDILEINNGTTRIGIDREMGASVTLLSWKTYPSNSVNIHDPGRLIQQSYYAGKRLDRSADGQSKAWVPWTWNPIQGGGTGSWAKVKKFELLEKQTLYSETIPKLWDMPNEDADAVMKQWTSFEPEMPNVIVVRCELICQRKPDDRWGGPVNRHQELPACYFTRNFSQFKSYLGKGKWRKETQAPGPPWGRANPPLKALACFTEKKQGIAVFSPSSTEHWNFGPHGGGDSADAKAAPCVHLAPISTVKLGPKSTLKYRYWMVVGTESEISARLDVLREKYQDETYELINP